MKNSNFTSPVSVGKTVISHVSLVLTQEVYKIQVLHTWQSHRMAILYKGYVT